jgi:hypothetical protein
LKNDDDVCIPHLSFILLAVHTFTPQWAYFHPVVEGPVSRYFFFLFYLPLHDEKLGREKRGGI